MSHSEGWALLAGADQITELSLMWSVFEAFGPEHAPQDRAFLPELSLSAEDIFDQLEARREGPANQELFIFLVGRLELRRRNLTLFLGPKDRSGLRLEELIVELEDIPALQRILLIQFDADPQTLALAQALAWPPMDLLCLGPHLPEALRQALKAEIGLRTASAVAQAMPGACSHRPQTIIAANHPSAALDADPDAERHIKEYLQALTAQANHLPFGDVRDKDALPELDLVYVEPHTEHADRDEAQLRREPKKVTLHQAMARHRCLFLTGDPGSGKTTFFHRVLVEVGQHLLRGQPLPGGLPKRPFPVLVTLRDFAAELGTSPPGSDCFATRLRQCPATIVPRTWPRTMQKPPSVKAELYSCWMDSTRSRARSSGRRLLRLSPNWPIPATNSNSLSRAGPPRPATGLDLANPLRTDTSPPLTTKSAWSAPPSGSNNETMVIPRPKPRPRACSRS